MSKPKVLIVGCGSVGLCQGYYLSAGADITYLVRTGRRPAFVPPKQLYNYKEDALFTFSSYRVIESVSEVTGETFEFIFDTLDGHTARSENGVATLQAVGTLLNEPQNASAFLLYQAIGLDMRKHYARTLLVEPSRLSPAMSMLAHQPTPEVDVPETANKELVAKADMLYIPSPPNVGLVVVNVQPELTKRFEVVYNKNGKVVVSRLPAFLYDSAPLVVILQLVAWDTDGFRPFSQLRANSELWALMLRAQSEILNLPRHGWTGWLLSFVFGSWATAKLNMALVDGAKPLRYEQFNKFHHGGKVAKQDLVTLEDLLAEGEKSGRKMEALREIVKRARKIHA